MEIEQIDPKEAFERIQDEGAVYLDVRTKEECAQGQAKGAVNIPILEGSGEDRKENANFLPDIEKNFDEEAILVVGCRTGGRSQKACEILYQAGYHNIANIQGGFIGTSTAPGWSSLGLPVES